MHKTRLSPPILRFLCSRLESWTCAKNTASTPSTNSACAGCSDCMPDKDDLNQAKHVCLLQAVTCSPGQVRCKRIVRIPKNTLHRKLAMDPSLHDTHLLQGVCKYDLRSPNIRVFTWEEMSAECSRWQQIVSGSRHHNYWGEKNFTMVGRNGNLLNRSSRRSLRQKQLLRGNAVRKFNHSWYCSLIKSLMSLSIF